ncbi:hypothetical protein NI389_05615 [Pseudoalteromonas xiamenensis]|uniref:hypothetical protein n=1 Tax=Pseudoalteromonas xiamenensis TaxID=882626 RepID=UPI0027E5967B|nr:hypothetical protein [Pseudoalteromonas xiamenensis]WMN60888.1 hypothetical protein NI389_05615 [Pseudoalteromonas xiamenensis]
MVDSPIEWPWSSYQAAIGLRKSPDWLATDALLLLFAKSRKTAIKRYSDFVAQGIGVDIWQNLKNQVFLGSSEFVEQHLKTEQDDADLTLSEVPIKQSERVHCHLATLNKCTKTTQSRAWQTRV